MRAFFDATTRLALRFRWVTIAITLMLIGLGLFSYTQLNQELIPDIEFPQTFILAQNGGASSEQMLTMYSIPLEDSNKKIDGVVNIESTSNNGLTFITVRNEFGLNQSRVTDDVRTATNNLLLPTRKLVPAEGESPASMIGQLSPEAVAWLYAYAQEEDINFGQTLSPAVWRSFSPEALGVFPVEIFNNLETNLQAELIAKRVENDSATLETVPELPASWVEDHPTVDRFSTVEDLAELTTSRSLDSVLNTLMEDGFIIGGLGTTEDLTLGDMMLFMGVQAQCEDYLQRSHRVTDENPCSFIQDLSADIILGLNPELAIALPSNYFEQLPLAEQNRIAENYLATQLTGTQTPVPNSLLPDSWRVDAPSLLTFNFSDLPLGYVTVSSDVMSEAELDAYVNNVLITKIKDIDTVADVTVFGGGVITYETDEPDPATDDTNTDTNGNGDDANTVEDTSPELPTYWQESVAAELGIELKTANDLLAINSVFPMAENAAAFLNLAYQFGSQADAETTNTEFGNLSLELLTYLNDNEEGFLANLSPEVIAVLNPEVVAELPLDTPDASVNGVPELPIYWQESVAAELGIELKNADDLLAIGDSFPMAKNAAAFLNLAYQFGSQADAETTNTEFGNLSLELLTYLSDNEEGFLANLSPEVASALNPEVVAELPFDSAPAPTVVAIDLGQYWTDLSAQPALAGTPLNTTADLVAYEGDAAQTLSTIIGALQDGGYNTLAILLANDLSPEAVDALIGSDDAFLANLAATEAGHTVLSYLNVAVLQSETVSVFIDETVEGDLQSKLQAIRDGEQAAAIDSVDTGNGEVELIEDPDAPELPNTWGQVGGFIGAKMERANDIINARILPRYASAADLVNSFAIDPRGSSLVTDLQTEHWLYVGENDPTFWSELSSVSLLLIAPDVVPNLPPDVQARIANLNLGFVPPSAPITRTNGESSLVLIIYKNDDANTVNAWHDVQDVLDGVDSRVNVNVPFEQASFIEESIRGVQNEGTSGAIMAIVVILIFMNLSVRSTLVTSVSIPGSVMIALVMMKYVPPNMYNVLNPILEDAGRDSTLGSILQVVIRLFPKTYTLNIMTLSGLTVAIGRVVDDSIVVLENIYRNIMHGEEKRTAILNGTREVSVAIFAATLTTMVVFLPLGLFGGVIGSFFLPFGLAVTYSLAASFLVAITVVPVLAELFISKDSMPEEGQIAITNDMGGFEKAFTGLKNRLMAFLDGLSDRYVILIGWVLKHRWLTIGAALLTLVFGMFILTTLPQTFLPSFGDPTITISVNLPAETADGTPITILDTERKVSALEAYLADKDVVESVQTFIGGEINGFDPTVDPDNVTETRANIQVAMASQVELDALVDELRTYSENLFNDLDGDGTPDEGVEAVRVSGASGDGGFSGFSLVMSGDDDITIGQLAEYNQAVIAELESLDGLVNVDSSLGNVASGGDDTTIIRIDGTPAIRYTAELETSDTIGITNTALLEVQDTVDKYAKDNGLDTKVVISKGFDSEQQEEGFQQIGFSMLIATLIVYFLLALTFKHVLHPITILVSLPLAIVGAAVALKITGRVLGLSSMIGLLMLIGIVVTNAVVLLDRVQQNRREKGMDTYDALVEAGHVRLRPILMTAISTMTGVLPLALGFTEGAIIAAELGTVVLGGLVSSTVLTLIVVPVVYSLFDSLVKLIFGDNKKKQVAA